MSRKIYIVILRLTNHTKLGVSKTEVFSEEQNRIAVIAKALGHPARVAILQHLFDTKSCVCGDLVDIIGLAQSTISQHLKELKNIGLIKGDIEGTKVCYCIDQEEWSAVKTLLTEFLSQEAAPTVECC